MEYIEGGFKRDLGNGKSLYLYHEIFNNRLCIGPTGDLSGYDDSW